MRGVDLGFGMSSPSLPTVQKAWMVVRQGTPRDALQLKTDVPVPTPKKDEVLVRVHAAALNPIGWKLMALVPNALARRPYPAEHDLAGVIVDANGTAFANGDEVIGFIPFPLQFRTRQGALAQYATLPQDHVAHKPKTLTWEAAAALPLAGLTAIQALRAGGYDPLDPTPAPPAPNPLFINGGSTSVGIYAIQLAKTRALHVTAAASARNTAFVHAVGADVCLDYTARPLAEQLAARGAPPFGMVLDAAGVCDTALYARSEAYVVPGGAYVTTGPFPGHAVGWWRTLWAWAGVLARPRVLGGTPTRWRMVQSHNDPEDMALLCALVERGALRPYVDSTYEFASALDAYDRIMTGRATGKVIVKVE